MTALPENLFEALLKTYKHKNSLALLDIVKRVEEGTLTPKQYEIFRANFIARTLFTLPEVLAASTQAALDLSPKRTAYGATTAFEEAGEGDPEKLHPSLMVHALNYHGRKIFKLEPLDEKRMMQLIKLLDSVNQVIVMQKFKNNPDHQAIASLKKNGIFDIEAQTEHCFKSARSLGVLDEADRQAKLFAIQANTIAALNKMGVTTETILYGQEQLSDMRSQIPGYIQGVAFAHEGLADDMMFNVFKILYADIARYKSPDDFMKHVYPYFAAHGDYLSMVKGQQNTGDGIEAIHAQREIEKITELDAAMSDEALKGAQAFAERNAKVWNGLLAAIQSLQEGKLQLTLTNKASHAL